MSDFLHDRERALEDSFFFKKDQELLAQMKQAVERNMEKSALREVSGISDDALLDHLIDAGISAKTTACLALVPLVAVAWADGEIKPKEREAIMVIYNNAKFDFVPRMTKLRRAAKNRLYDYKAGLILQYDFE